MPGSASAQSPMSAGGTRAEVRAAGPAALREEHDGGHHQHERHRAHESGLRLVARKPGARTRGTGAVVSVSASGGTAAAASASANAVQVA